MSYLLFFVYFFLLSWLLTKSKFVKKAGLPATAVILLFAMKVVAGLAMGWVFRNDVNADTWQYHRLALDEYHLLFNNPGEYFSNLFQSGYEHKYDGVLQMKNSYWNDLRTNLVIKLVSILHIFSFGNFYVNVVLFNGIVFMGHMALFRTFKAMLNGLNIILVICCFLLPSLLLFTSTIHKDGIIFFAISFAFYGLYKLKTADKKWMPAVLLLMGAMLIFLIRSYIFLALAPALLAWNLSFNKSNTTAIKIYALVVGACLLLFFLSFYFSPVSLPGLIVEKQGEFMGLEKARSFIGVPALEANPLSFITATPRAIGHLLLRPFFTDYQMSPLLFAFAAEWYIYIVIAMLFLFRRRKGGFNLSFIFCCLLFALIIFLLIGYTVPILWAIVRYRSVYLPFILAPLLSSIDWNALLKRNT